MWSTFSTGLFKEVCHSRVEVNICYDILTCYVAPGQTPICYGITADN